MPPIERALSVRQPYADQILRGRKRIEYRGRVTNLRERVYIYASLTPAERDEWDDYGREPGDLPTGVIIGSVEIGGCRWDPDLEWYEWLLSKPKRVRPYRHPKNQPQPGIWRPRF
jgi:hypothetical protein